MTIQIDPMDAAMIIQSLDATDWSYCGEEKRAELLKAKIRTAMQAFAKAINEYQPKMEAKP